MSGAVDMGTMSAEERAAVWRNRCAAYEAIVRRTAEHFDGTDAPLGIDARAALAAAGVES